MSRLREIKLYARYIILYSRFSRSGSLHKYTRVIRVSSKPNWTDDIYRRATVNFFPPYIYIYVLFTSDELFIFGNFGGAFEPYASERRLIIKRDCKGFFSSLSRRGLRTRWITFFARYDLRSLAINSWTELVFKTYTLYYYYYPSYLLISHTHTRARVHLYIRMCVCVCAWGVP